MPREQLIPIKTVDDFIAESTSECKRCENFATAACPQFRKATSEYHINPETLQQGIEEMQEGQELNPCQNAPMNY